MQYALYYFDSCPYCQRVLKALPELKVKVEKRNVKDEPKWHQEKLDATGSSQVPCLKITDNQGQVQWLFESMDIIHYLQKQSA